MKIKEKKQVDALETLKLKKLEVMKDNKSDNKLLVQENFFNKLSEERMDEIQKMSDDIDFDN